MFYSDKHQYKKVVDHVFHITSEFHISDLNSLKIKYNLNLEPCK